jgi:hypothetical protein
MNFDCHFVPVYGGGPISVSFFTEDLSPAFRACSSVQLVGHAFAFCRARHLPDPDVRREEVRPSGDGQHADGASPGVPDEEDLVLAKALREMRRQIDHVVHELRHGHA